MSEYSGDSDSVEIKYMDEYNDAVLKWEFKLRQEELNSRRNKSGIKASAEYRARLRAKMLAEKEAMEREMLKEKDQELIRFSQLKSTIDDRHVRNEEREPYSIWEDIGTLPFFYWKVEQKKSKMSWRNSQAEPDDFPEEIEIKNINK